MCSTQRSFLYLDMHHANSPLMTRFFLPLFAAVLVPCAALAQWEPFPHNAELFYAAAESDGHYQLVAQHWDSTSVHSPTVNLHQNGPAKALRGYPCLDSARRQNDFPNWAITFAPNASNSQHWYIGSPDAGLHWYHHSQPGFTWSWNVNVGNTQTVSFNHLETRLDTVLGQPDSVKVYDIAALNSQGQSSGLWPSGTQAMLSKHHGLVYWPRYDGYSLKLCTLLTLQTDSSHLGARLPTFEDYFHYQIGDEYYWEGQYENWDPMDYYNARWHYKDKIIAATTTATAHKIYFHRTIHLREYSNYNGGEHNDVVLGPQPDSMIFYRSEFEHVLAGLPGSFGLGNHRWQRQWGGSPGAVGLHTIQSIEMTVDGADTVFAFTAETMGGIDTTWCMYYYWPQFNGFSLRTDVGLQERTGLYSFHGLSEYLQGAILNGDTVGEITPVGIADAASMAQPPLKLWPNPAANSAVVQGLQLGEGWMLLDVAGRLVDSGRAAERLELNLEKHPEGLYLFRTESGRYAKVLVQR